MNSEYTILLPTRPQPDTIAGIFLLSKFGEKYFPGISRFKVQIKSSLVKEESFENLITQKIFPIDVGGGLFDHHGTDFCASELIAQALGLTDKPELKKLLAYTARDDKEGKGTLSEDPLDRAFGLSGLIAALNKNNPKNPQYVVEQILPLLEAHYLSAYEHHVTLPNDVKTKKQNGEFTELSVRHQQKNIRLFCVISSKPAMPTFLRSNQGGRADVVVQKGEDTEHVCVLTRQDCKINLSNVVGLIRIREKQIRAIPVTQTDEYYTQTERIDEVPMWYYDTATNSILNGGPHSLEVEPSLIPWEELKKIVKKGLELPT